MVTNGDEFTMGSNTKKVTQTNQTNRRISWISGFHGIQISKRKTTKCFGYLVVSARKILVKWHHFPRVKIKNNMKPPTSWKRDSKLDIRRLFTNDPVWWTWFSMHSLIWSTGSPFPPRKGVWFSRSPSASDPDSMPDMGNGHSRPWGGIWHTPLIKSFLKHFLNMVLRQNGCSITGNTCSDRNSRSHFINKVLIFIWFRKYKDDLSLLW